MSEVLQAQYGISVKEVLSLDAMKYLQLVGGSNGTDRIIKFINVIEVPDITDWIMDGEFLLTTGYSFRENPERIKDLIPEIYNRGGAGLAIKPKRFIETIPEELKNEADAYGIPLLEVPYDLSFAELISPILEVISNKQNTLLRQIEFAHKELIELVLQGSSLQEICDCTTKILGNPIVISSDYYDELTMASSIKEKEQEFIRQMLLKSEENGLELQHRKMKFGNIKEIEYTFVLEDYDSNLPLNQAIRIPVIVNHKTYGYIYSIYSDGIIDEHDILVLERAATVVALEFMKRKAVYEIEKNYRNEFLDLLLSGECKEYDEGDIVKRGYDNYHIDLSKPVAVALVDVKNGKMNGHNLINKKLEEEDQAEKLIGKISKINQAQKSNVFVGMKGNYIVVLMQMNETDDAPSRKKEIADNLQKEIRESSHVPHDQSLDIGIGNYYADITKIQNSYQEAQKALKICQLTSKPSVVHFENLGFYRILYQKTREELEEFMNDFLSPLLEYDKQNNGELIKTLTVYFNMNRNLKKTSKQMYTHYNTVLYRIEKIEKLTGCILSNPENSLNLEIAINIHKILKE